MRPPDGIPPDHQEEIRGLGRHASPLSIVALGVVVGAAALGVFGGGTTVARATAPAAALAVEAPLRVRSGELLEMRVTVTGASAIRELAIAVDAGLWRGLTLNAMLPTPADESFEGGAFRFTFHEVPAGGAFLMQSDLQVNPSLRGRNAGTIRVYDGERPLVALATALEVLP